MRLTTSLGERIGHRDGQVVLLDLPCAVDAPHDAGAAAAAEVGIVEELVERRVAAVARHVDVPHDGHIGPAAALVEMRLGVRLELVECPAFVGIGPDEDAVGGEQAEILVELRRGRRLVKAIQQRLDLLGPARARVGDGDAQHGQREDEAAQGIHGRDYRCSGGRSPMAAASLACAAGSTGRCLRTVLAGSLPR